MELTRSRTSYVTIGFAIFAMFFGAGNSIFPLLSGIEGGGKNIFSFLGLCFSGIVIPMSGLVAMILYKGDYKAFFYRLGKVPGFFLISLIMIVIGPFAGIPRCITLSFATLKPYLGPTTLIIFSFCTCILVFLKTIKKSKLIVILGKVLTPFLLVFLAVVIVKGFYGPKEVYIPQASDSAVFLNGLTTGYQMMDLLASFFLATTVLTCIKESGYGSSPKLLFKSILLSSVLLAVIYGGFSYVGAFNSLSFQHLSKDTLLAAVGQKILGGKLAIVMGLAFALACLTTIITLVTVFSDFIYEEFFNKKIPYIACILATLVTAFFFSNLGFEGICKMVNPIVNICYPVLIVLTLLNILHKLYDFKTVRTPVFLIFVGSFLINSIF